MAAEPKTRRDVINSRPKKYEPVDHTQPEMPLGTQVEPTLHDQIRQTILNMFGGSMPTGRENPLDDLLNEDPDDFDVPDIEADLLSGYEVQDIPDEQFSDPETKPSNNTAGEEPATTEPQPEPPAPE